MSEAREYVLLIDKDKPRAAQIAKDVAEKLQKQQTTLVDIVVSAQEYGSEDDVKIRARVVSYLSAIIAALPPNFLTRQQIQVLCDWLCDRMEDGGAFDGLSKLQGMDRFTNEMARKVIRALFENFQGLQGRSLGARFQVVRFLNESIDKRRKAIKDMGDESLVQIINLVAGEKDPRNLMIVFSILRVVMLEWDITNHAGDMFDAVYSYFPITFRPNPNDPYQITAQDLKDRLRECLSCSSLLAQYAIPCLLEKLDTTSTNTKKDALQTLASCANHYEAGVMSQYSIPLWDALKYEVLSAQEPELAEEALITLRSIAFCLSKSTNTSPTSAPLILYLKPITKECLEHLQEPAQRQAKASGDILKAVSSASVAAFEIIIKTLMMQILVIHQSADGILQQRALLEVLNQLFESCITVFGSWTTPGLTGATFDLESNPLMEFKDKFIALYGQALMGTVKEEVSFRLTAAKGLLLLSKMRSYLEENEVGLFVQYFDDIVLNEESYGRDELKTTAMAGLAEISASKSRLISDITFPAFMARLPDSEDEAAQAKGYQATLEGLAEISIQKELLDTLVRRLLNRLDILFRLQGTGPFPYTCAILSTLHHVFTRTAEQADKTQIALDGYFDRIVVDLCGTLRKNEDSGSGGPLANESVLDLLGRIDNLIVRNSAPIRLARVADNVYDLFTPRQPSKADPDTQYSLPTGPSMITSTWLLAALPRDLAVSLFQIGNMSCNVDALIEMTRHCSNSVVRIACLRQIALFTNKHFKASDLQQIIDKLSGLFTALISESEHSSALRDWNIRLVFTLAKALVLRLAPATNQLLSDLVALLDSSKYDAGVSHAAASAFGSILAPDEVLSKTNYAQSRLLVSQRVFQVLTPLISERFKASSSPEEKQNYLSALSGVVATVPSDIVMPELPTLLPLLLQSLDISDQTVKMATLETLAVVISNNPTALEESGHIPALAKRLLASAVISMPVSKSSTPQSLPRTRRLAARCLALLPTHVSGSASRTNPLLALKREVLQGLMRVLDDPRRDVRKEAVDARGAWIRQVDDPDEDGDDD